MKRWVGAVSPLVVVPALAVSLAAAAAADEVQVAVASNFSAPMREIAAEFHRETGHRAVLSFGSSGHLYAQIRNGAPFQLFLSGEEEKPARLEREGFTSGKRFTYATGTLVLWSSSRHRVDPKEELLSRGRPARLAIANPKLAPYGAAAVETLRNLGVLAALRPQLVQGENIAQAYQFVASGSAELGMVALSQVMRGGKITEGSAWVVPAGLHAPILQDAVLLSGGRGNSAAEALAAYLQSSRAKAIIRSYGYGTKESHAP